MACNENVFGGHTASSTVSADENGNQEPHSDVTLQCPESMLSSIPKIDVEPRGLPHVLRPSVNMLTNAAREQLKHHSERTGSSIPVNSFRALQQPYGSSTAVAKATAEVNSSGGLAGLRQRGQESINMSQVFSGSSLALVTGRARLNNGGTERGANSERLYLPSLQGQGSFPPRGPQVKGHPHIPKLMSGIMMEVPLGKKRIPYKERLAHVSFPLGSPKPPRDNWSRPVPLASNTQDLPSHPTAHSYTPPLPLPSFTLFLPTPIAFAPPPIVSPPHHSDCANYNFWEIQTSESLNRDNK
ncbi:proline-rich protein 32 [Erinaceus europaeus]|uniref:Proline-rich protein 32 n=1 Tax=Erinaceus europaeus TaxID=9365 RepID=A0ABM3WRM6_ERIEU|nr:proline-rich protein 32 [Erinaceus europaeus]